MLTEDRLREVLRYDHESGVFTWLVRLADNVKAGTEAGCIAKTGYRLIAIDKRQHRAHRLAWLYVYGSFPAAQIDHINGDRGDNRIANLRPATNAENNRNVGARANNTSGFKGVSFFKKTGRWKAQATINGKNKHIGYYASPEEASAAYEAYVKPHHGEYFRKRLASPVMLATAEDLCRQTNQTLTH